MFALDIQADSVPAVLLKHQEPTKHLDTHLPFCLRVLVNLAPLQYAQKILQQKENDLGFSCPSTHPSSTDHLDAGLYLAKLGGKGHRKKQQCVFHASTIVTPSAMGCSCPSPTDEHKCRILLSDLLHRCKEALTMSTPLPTGHIAFPSLSGSNARIQSSTYFLLPVINVILVNEKKKKGKMTEHITSNSKPSQQFLQQKWVLDMRRSSVKLGILKDEIRMPSSHPGGEAESSFSLGTCIPLTGGKCSLQKWTVL